jgi:hypothetical protein
MSKYFLTNPNKVKTDKSSITFAEEQSKIAQSAEEKKAQTRQEAVKRTFNVNHVGGRVVLIVDLEQKNLWTFSDGTVIAYERNWNCLDNKHRNQVLGTVLSAENIPTGAIALFHHNSLHEVNHLNDHSELTTEEYEAGVRIISIEEAATYLWKMPEESEWKPTKNFCIAERVFEPYQGLLVDIDPKKIQNVLWIKTGEYANNVARTLIACDFPVIFRNEKGVEETLIRCRHFEDQYNDEREELIAIDHHLTKRVLSGDLLVGIDEKTAKTII